MIDAKETVDVFMNSLHDEGYVIDIEDFAREVRRGNVSPKPNWMEGEEHTLCALVDVTVSEEHIRNTPTPSGDTYHRPTIRHASQYLERFCNDPNNAGEIVVAYWHANRRATRNHVNGIDELGPTSYRCLRQVVQNLFEAHRQT